LAFLTNFAGFLPALLETSPQAQFLIPMTLSLSSGLLLGMAASLILTPVCYAILGKGSQHAGTPVCNKTNQAEGLSGERKC
jgi:multidrug efflux pump subunit AcrB